MLERLFFYNLEISFSISFLFLFLFCLSKISGLQYTANCRAKIFFIIALRLAVPFNFVLPWSCFYIQAPYQFFLRDEPLRAVEGAAATAAAGLSGLSFAQLLTAVWFAGTWAYFLYYIAQLSILRNQILRWGRQPKEDVIALLWQLKSELGILSPVSLKIIPTAKVPMVTGIRRPVILLPQQSYTDQELRMIFRHELAHVKKHHPAFKLLLLTVGGLHWFNPIVGLMIHRAVREMEFSCDQRVIQGQGKEFAREYAGCILSVAKKSCFAKPQTHLLVSSMESSKEFLRRRMDNILVQGKQKNGRFLIAVVAAGVMLVSPLFLFRGSDKNQVLLQTLSDSSIQSIFLERRVGSVILRQECTEEYRASLTRWLNRTRMEPALLPPSKNSAVRYRIQTGENQIVVDSDGQGYVEVNGKAYRQVIQQR